MDKAGREKQKLCWFGCLQRKKQGFFNGKKKKKEFSTGTWAESQNEMDVLEAQAQTRDYVTDMFFPK